MPRVLVSTVLYETGRPWFGAYAEGLRAAAAGSDVTLLLAVDDFVDAAAAAAPLADALAVQMVDASGGTPTAVRRRMLERVRATEVEAVVFFDMDDVPLADAFARHFAALDKAEISYGDMHLIAEDGAVGERTFFAGAKVPARLATTAPITGRNFLGFTNTALRRSALTAEACAVPDGVAAADWWLYTTLIDGGCRARRTTAPVAAYRTHRGNLLGARPDPSPTALARRCRIARQHYAALPPTPARRRHDDALARLEARLARPDPALARLAERVCARPGVWFDDITRLAGALAAAENEIDEPNESQERPERPACASS